MLTLTFGIAATSFFVCGFAVPSNGKIVFTAYSVLHAIALAGINGGSINLIYEYVESENKTGALAFSFAASGLFGFLTTLVASKLVSFIQAHGFSIFGISLYAQQVVSFIAAFIVILIIIYLNTVVKGLNKRKDA
jgi:MFS family permease